MARPQPSQPYCRVLQTVKSEGQDHYRSFWRNERAKAARSRYLDHFAMDLEATATPG